MEMTIQTNKTVINNSKNIFARVLLLTGLFALISFQTVADVRTQAKRMHDRLAGTPPSEKTLNDMVNLMPGNAIEAAKIAIENKNFYNVTLKNFVTPWTNEEQTVFPAEDPDKAANNGVLNDYTATVIGIIRDDRDFREILYANVLYKGKDSLGLTNPYRNTDNAHYKELEERVGLNLKNDLVPANEAVQSTITGLDAAATAGILTSRAGAKSFFVDGTNRAMFRFTMMNHLCNDMEQVKDVTLVPDRIRQDVSRSPGGDSRIFMNSCIGCHTGMDPLTQAFAYYNFDKTTDSLDYNRSGDTDPVTETRVQEKYLINSANFKYGYITTNDDWENYWRVGKNALLGWNSTPLSGSAGKGSGAKSMGQELAYSDAFARCQVEKVFKAVCLHPALNSSDRDQITNTLIPNFKSSGYHLKQVFAETAVYCMGN